MKKTLLILLAILTLACSSEDSLTNEQEQQDETFNLTTDVNSVMPLRYVIVNTDITLSQNTYNGVFGGQEIVLTKSSENTLIFTVPEVNEGNYILELTIDDKYGYLIFFISNNIVQDVNEVLNTELLNPLNELNQNIDDLITDTSLSQEVTASLASANQMLDDFFTKFNTLSNEEKIETARFYNANPLFTSDYLNISTRSINGNPDYDCFNFNARSVVLTTVAIIAFTAIAVELGAAGPAVALAALGGFVAGVYASAAIISGAQEKLLDDCLYPLKNSLFDDLSGDLTNGTTDLRSPNNFEMYNNTFKSFSIISTDRHIVSSDINNTNEVVSITVEKLNLVHEKWDILKNKVNTLITNTTNWFNSWFSSSTANYELITYDFDEIPSNSEEFENDGESEFIIIEDFPADVDVEVILESNNSISLKLNTDESTLPRTVTGKIKYDDGDFKTESEFNTLITLGDVHPTWATGSWNNWQSQGWLEDTGSGCWTTITRTVNGEIFYFRYYPLSFYRYELFSDGTATLRQPTNGCEDIPGETEYGTWSVINNKLKIVIANELWVEVNNFTETITDYEYFVGSQVSGELFLNNFKR